MWELKPGAHHQATAASIPSTYPDVRKRSPHSPQGHPLLCLDDFPHLHAGHTLHYAGGDAGSI